MRDTFINLGVVFFGGYAANLYARNIPHKERRFLEKIPDFDVLHENPEECAIIIKERLEDAGYKNITSIHHDAIGEIVPEHIEIRIKNEILGFIYKPIACHNYNTIKIQENEINVATIDTILSFYLAFTYVETNYYFLDRILCMTKYLFDLEQKTRLSQRGLLKRFGPKCIGKQETMENIRAKKTSKFLELKKDKKSREFEKYFLKYVPSENEKSKKNEKSTKTSKKKTEKKRKSSGLKSLLLKPFA